MYAKIEEEIKILVVTYREENLNPVLEKLALRVISVCDSDSDNQSKY